MHKLGWVRARLGIGLGLGVGFNQSINTLYLPSNLFRVMVLLRVRVMIRVTVFSSSTQGSRRVILSLQAHFFK